MKSGMPIVDTHFHIFNSYQLNMPWLAAMGGAVKPVYTLEEYLAATAGFNIIQSCYEEVDVAKEDLVKEADAVLPICVDETNRVVAATIGGDLAQEGFKDYIAKYADNAYVKAVRQVLIAVDPSVYENEVFVNNVRLLGSLNIMVDIAALAQDIHYGAALAEACPETTFVLNHCGLLSPATNDQKLLQHWEDGIRRYAQAGNVICKISDFLFLAENDQWQVDDALPIVEFCLDAFGEDRVVFGTNWPVSDINGSVSRWFDVLDTALKDRSDAFKHKFFHKNAEKYYGLAAS